MDSNTTGIVVTPKVGDILVSTFGYEACIARFAKVVAVTKASVKVVSLRANETHNGPMEWTSVPDVDAAGEEVSTRRFRACGNTYSVRDGSISTYRPWSGKPVNCYNYH